VVIIRISSFAALTYQERRRYFECISIGGLPAAFADEAEMERYLLGPAFERGSTYLTLWDGEALDGAMGVVVREIAVRGEVFLTLLYSFAPDTDAVVAQLLQEAYAVVGRSGGAAYQVVVKIGVGAQASHLRAPLERAGCTVAYRILDMVRSLDGGLPARPALRFEPLTAGNLMDYLHVHNAAFLGSPNGAQLVPAELEEMRREARSRQFLQVGYAGAVPAAILEVDVRGDVGQIQTVGVAPAFQGRGLGRAAVARALQVVADAGAWDAHLQVVEVNTPAVKLYAACGFVVDRVVSTWYYGPALGRAV
jgi:ribosomal protein S18 acetylase RimI-like enzyme